MKLLCFVASWCGPSQRILPELPEGATCVDIDHEPERTQALGIKGVPTLVLVDEEGNPLAMRVGTAKREEIEAWINESVSPAG